MQCLSVYCTLTLHHVIEGIPKRFKLSVQYRTHRCNKNSGGDWNVIVRIPKKAMICTDNKYECRELTNFDQINHNFSTKKSHVTGIILNWGPVRLHTLTRNAVLSFCVRICNKLVKIRVN